MTTKYSRASEPSDAGERQDLRADNEKAASFTPGPWKVCGPAGYIYSGKPYHVDHDMLVAQVRGWGHLTGTGGGCAFSEEKAIAIQEANARLIAAAPTMYDALTLVDLHFRRNQASGNFQGDDEHEAWSAVSKAIAKAEGRT